MYMKINQMVPSHVSVQVHGESPDLVDGSLINLFGVTLLWRTAEGLGVHAHFRCPVQSSSQ